MIDISRANQVWSTDITYIKTNGGMAYLAAIIDWHSKAVLAHKISNTMDCALVMDVLDQALAHYGQPEVFNTDQGSQYTSDVHTQRLKIKVLLFQWMVKVVLQIIFASNVFGEAQSVNAFT